MKPAPTSNASSRLASEPWLAHELLCKGVQVCAAQEDELRRTARWLAVAFGSPRLEIELLTPSPARLLVAVHTRESDGNPPRLEGSDGRWQLSTAGGPIPVRIPSPPAWYGIETSTGRKMGEIAWLLGSVLIFFPTTSCGYGLSGASCRFCRAGSRSFDEREMTLGASEVAQVVSAASRERRLRYVYFPAQPSFDLEDGGVCELEPLVRAARRHTSALIAASFHPPRTLRWLDHAYAMGVDAAGIHLEVIDVETLSRALPGRARHLGKSRYFAALHHAARIFPAGAIWSEVVLGWEPGSALSGDLRALVEVGVIPVLIPFRSEDRPSSFPVSPPAAEELRHACLTVEAALRAKRLCPQWIPPLPYALPRLDDSLQQEPVQARMWAGVSRAQVLGSLALPRLARLRRALRVRSLDDSTGEAPHASR